MKTLYSPIAAKSWRGRIDKPVGDDALRWHQVIKPLDLNNSSALKKVGPNAITLLGFACDLGVKRNQGRPGAKLGPQAIRQALASLPISVSSSRKRGSRGPNEIPVSTGMTNLFDAGTIAPSGADLESAQDALTAAVQKILSAGSLPILLGGGHEIAWPHYLALAKFHREKKKNFKLGVINFDAHFDLREPVNNQATSGTSFWQIASWCKKNKEFFSYLCVGVQESANTARLFDTAKKFGVQTILAKDCRNQNVDQLKKQLRDYLKKHDAVYVTLCLDVFAQAFAPGVSAPQALGLFPEVVAELLAVIAQSGKIAGFDIAELNPKFDRDDQTAKLAAGIINTLVSQARFSLQLLSK